MKSDQKGFSLVELLVAVSILALVAVPVMTSMVLSAKTSHRVEERQVCLMEAENIMEQRKSDFSTWYSAEKAGSYQPPKPEEYAYDVSYEIAVVAEPCYSLKVTVTDENGVSVTLQGVVTK